MFSSFGSFALFCTRLLSCSRLALASISSALLRSRSSAHRLPLLSSSLAFCLFSPRASPLSSRLYSPLHSLCQMVPGGCLCRENLSSYFNISLCSISVVKTSGVAGRYLPRMQEGVGSNSTGGKISFSHLTLFRVEMLRIIL